MKTALHVLGWVAFLLGAAFVYILTRVWFMWFPVMYFPKPTEMHPPIPQYSLRTFGVPVRAGFAKRDITPSGIPWLGGYMPPHPAFVVDSRLWVKSLALKDAHGNLVVFVSCDLVGMLPTDVAEIKARIKGVPPDHILIMATHTHSGPDTIGFWLGRRKAYMRHLRDQVAAAINESIDSLGPAAVRYGRGVSPYGEKNVPNWANGSDENPPDPQIAVIQVLMKHVPRNRLVTLVNWSCHPDIAEGFAVTGDFPYFLSDRLKRRLGSETMFVQGAIGAVQPEAGNNDDKSAQTFLERNLGERLGDKVIDIMRHPLPMKNADIAVTGRTVRAPFENTQDIAFALHHHMVPNLLDAHGDIVTRVARVTLGPMTILTVPGELFPKIWWRVKPLMPGKTHMVFGLCNAEFGYILLPEDVRSGKHRYHVSVSIGPTFGQRTYEALRALAVQK